MGLFDRIAEARIQEALERGDLDDLPGSGEPLELEDLSRVPEDLRSSYILLKGANVLPEEMQIQKELLRLGDLLAACADDGERAELRGRRDALGLRLSSMLERLRPRPSARAMHARYAQALRRRLS